MTRDGGVPDVGELASRFGLAVGGMIILILVIGAAGLSAQFGLFSGLVILGAVVIISLLFTLVVSFLFWEAGHVLGIIIAGVVRIRSYLWR